MFGMKPRIKELAEQVDREFTNPGARQKAIKRFAELIVEECIKKIDKDVVVFTKNDVDTKNLCIGIIKQHFGV